MKLKPEQMIDLPPLPASTAAAGGYSSLAWTGLLTRGPATVVGSRGTLEPIGPVANSIGPGADNSRPRIEGANLLPTQKELDAQRE